MARGAGGAAAGADSLVAISNADSHPVYRRCCAQNRLICMQPPVRPARPLAAHTRRSGCANIFRLGRRGLAVLPPDSAKDHETLHTYSLPGIVMCVRNTLLSCMCGRPETPTAARPRAGPPDMDGCWRHGTRSCGRSQGGSGAAASSTQLHIPVDTTLAVDIQLYLMATSGRS
jgi:hypothetical protein